MIDELQILIKRTTIDGAAVVDTQQYWPKVRRVPFKTVDEFIPLFNRSFAPKAPAAQPAP